MADHREENDDERAGIEDMIKLSVLDERSILSNLEVRYGQGKIYTYTGSILVSVNPYQMFNIYGLDMVKKYEGQPLGALPPHLFAIGSASYTRMMKNIENQVIVISGESGSGKTEATKLIMQYLAAVNKSGGSTITEQILEANPLLESFGNAKTIRNDNSSRFGKYIEVFFKSWSIVGARTSEYLLEKSRIVTQAKDERNYHVFYELLDGMSDDMKKKFGLQTASKYFYLNQGGISSIDSRNDAENFKVLSAAMQVLNFENHEQDTIFKMLASVLHLGNIFFNRIQIDNHDTVQLGSDIEIKWISHLLELSDDWLKQALTQKVTETRGDKVLTPYSIDQALDARDAIAKALYSRLFTWLVERVNFIMCRSEKEKSTSLALLDIFGFEDFPSNSFEQLCINYANETLQFFFNQHIFRLEQKEYAKERIDWTTIEFQDNQPVIDLIAAKPAGILHILDDECNFPQASDASFLEKCHFHHSDNGLYGKPRMSDPEFFVRHYAGKIKYSVQHFLEKNKDTLRSDVVELLCESRNKLLSQMFKDMRDRHITRTLSKTTGRYVTVKPRTPTVAAGFSESLLSLIDTMSRCNPYFIRCIKPNSYKAAMTFEPEVVLDQLRYTGMLETIRIRKLGFPVRVKFPKFIERYRFLLLGQKIHINHLPSDVCVMILKTMGSEYVNMYRIGATKVFMKEKLEHFLDKEAKKIQDQAVLLIQKRVRTFLVRRKFITTLQQTALIQAHIRMWRGRRKFHVLVNGIVRLQAQYRMHRQRKKYLKTREEFKRKLEQEHLEKKRKAEKAQMEREKREKILRAETEIVNLDIPGELAFVFNKLDDWNTVHDDRHIITVVGDVKCMDMMYALPADINSFMISKFNSIFFKSPELFGVTLNPIRSSLTNLQGESLNRAAQAVFKLILRFMYDKNLSDKRERVLAAFIVQQGLRDEGLRDEIYCQLASQTWQNQKIGAAERAWILMASCLSGFPPSTSLYKYLLKYVSDVGIDGYKWLCQHKALQCAKIDAQLSRIYPPCLLEWRACQRKAYMALEVKFPDNVIMIGHVESWTTGEEFARHLLNLRGLNENNLGWTVVLQEDLDYYELMGYDYVLDLISEMEIAPEFPVCRSYFIVSSDRSREPHSLRRGTYHKSPHNAERDRSMKLVGILPDPIKINVTRLESRSIQSKEDEDGHFSMTSPLNQRRTGVIVDGLSESKINLRYTKRKAAPNPPMANGHLIANGFANGADHSMSIVEEEYNGSLAPTKLNSRYNNNIPDELSPSRINQRYMRVGKVNKGRQGAVAQKIATKRDQQQNLEKITTASDVSGQSDWSHWVEDVFSNALNEHVDALSDARSLENRLKGGGKGVPGPGMQQQVPPSQPGFSGGLTIPVNQPLTSLPAGIPQFSFVPTMVNTSTDSYLQQLTAAQQMVQQQAQQQALLQAFRQQQALLQAALQQQQQQQQQAAVLQQHQQAAAAYQQQQQAAAFQQQHQQAAALQQHQQATALQQQQAAMQASLQQQQLQQLLQQQQHQMNQQQPQPFNQTMISPDSSFNSVGSVFSQTNGTAAPLMVGVNQPSQVTAHTGLPSGIAMTTVADTTGAPKRIYKIKTHFEGQTEKKTVNQNHFPPPPPPPSSQDHRPVVSYNETRRVTHEQVNKMVPSPPPPPPPQFADKSMSSRMPPAPPPPPPIPSSVTDSNFDKESGTFTFKDRKGRARTVRIGKVVWPPLGDNFVKEKREVGKLEIDEQVARELDERFRPTNQIKKIQPPEKKETKKTKSLAETVHLATLQLLEKKLGGTSVAVETEPPKPPIPEPKVEEPPTLPKRPPPSRPIATQTSIKQTVSELIQVEPKLEKPKPEEPRPEPEPEHEPERQVIDYAALERVVTELFLNDKNAVFLTYHNVPWTLQIRKEVFYPRERLDNQLALHLVFCQIVQDVHNYGCIRISKEERIKMRGMLESHGITLTNYLTGSFKSQVKKIIVDTAKEWPTYFCRLFPVASSGNLSEVQYIGVSHSGIYLIHRVRSLVEDYLKVMEHIKFEEVIDVVLPSKTSIQISTKNKSMVFYTHRAKQVKEMIDQYLHESDKVNRYIVAMKDYITRESTLLSFRKGDVIKLMDADVDEGWLYGSLNGNVGYFPEEYVKPLHRHEVERTPSLRAQLTEHVVQRITRPPSRDGHTDNRSETSQGTVVPDGKFSMIEFAILHFRETIEKFEMLRMDDGSIRGTIKKIESLKLQNVQKHEQNRHGGSNDWSWKEQADLVKWTRSPIQTSLLKLQNPEMNKMALECFLCIMKYMGDYPLGSGEVENDCALKILKMCHKYPEIRDEVYCQLAKQTTSNRSMKPKSAVMGWRLFSIVAAYCDCSEVLRPYLFKYLETTASDPSRTHSGAAAICLQNLRKTFKYGGRKNVPLIEELQALADGRVSKRFSFIYSGSEREGMLHVRPCMVVHDAIEDVCSRLQVHDQVEVEEYTMFIRTAGGMFTRLRSDDYVLDVTAELQRAKQDYDFVFQRTVWYFPFRSIENVLYNELMYCQCIPDYKEGLLITMRDGVLTKQYEMDISLLAALLHRASDQVAMPTNKDLEHLLPDLVRKMPDYRPQQWLNRVHDQMGTIGRISSIESMAKFVEVLSRWPLFGSTFFRVKKVLTQPPFGHCILAVNKTGVLLLDPMTHDTFLAYTFTEVLSTRRYRSDSNQNYLDMKLGNLMVQKIVRIETDQGADISNLISQYMQVINRHRKRPSDKNMLTPRT